MKHLFRFLCVVMMLCYTAIGFSETTSLRVGDSYTITEPKNGPNTTGYYYNYQWEYDASVFNVVITETVGLGNNIARITLKQPFDGQKEIKCTADYTYGQVGHGTKTWTHTITCAPVDVALYPTVMTLDMGQSQTLQWQFNPSNSQYGTTVSFSSSNINVADVDFNGKVTARGAGTATITATTNYFTTATCDVTVNPMLASSISLNQSAITLPVSSTQTLTATVLPANTSDKTVTWSSSDESIATVNANGLVTAVSQGLATITATTNDGSNLSASCNVNVTQVSANAIQLDKTEVEMSKGQSIKLTATILPAGAPQRVTWSSSDPTVARVVGGNVYAQEMGECLITARTLDGTNLTADCLIMVYPEGEIPSPSGNAGDVNGDGQVNISDVAALINYLLNSIPNEGSTGNMDGLITMP